MKFISVCSGIEAASEAWMPLGLEPLFYSEIEKFPAAVLGHRHPNVPNLGDMTKFKEWNDYETDVLVGGTPCQSFSVAGLRKGLDDPRGNLMLTYLAIADRYRPRWVVWENVPGVLSSNGGRDFGTFLGALAKLGYGWSYRVLDAQYFGVPQRRRRVFVVGYLGDWRCATAVLFERESLLGNPPPSREERKEVAGSSTFGIDEECNVTANGFGPLLRGGQGGTRQAVATVNDYYNSHPADSRITGPHNIASTVSARYGTGGGNTPLVMAHGQANAEIVSDGSPSLTCNHEVPIVCHGTQDPCVSDISFALGRNNGQENVVLPINTQIATRGGKMGRGTGFGLGDNGSPSYTLQANHSHGVFSENKVRRLTPIECERLQGFPDNYTQIPWRNKTEDNCPLGPRYKAIGNSMAVPVMRWIGERIQKVNSIC